MNHAAEVSLAEPLIGARAQNELMPNKIDSMCGRQATVIVIRDELHETQHFRQSIRHIAKIAIDRCAYLAEEYFILFKQLRYERRRIELLHRH